MVAHSRRHLSLAMVVLFAFSLSCKPRVTPRGRTATSFERALVELRDNELPAFADDLDFAGLEEAIGRSLEWLARIDHADPGRRFRFGSEQVSIPDMRSTLVRFRELALARPTPSALSETLRREFRVFRSVGDGTGDVLFTGYYLPELRGSLIREGPFQVPLHRAPDDLVVARVKDFPTALSSDLTGRVEGGRLVPYLTRAEIARAGLRRPGTELCFVDSALDAFFLEIQGSGILRLPDGTSRVVTFAGKNGHRYEAIGNELVRRGVLRRQDVSAQAIRSWLLSNPTEQQRVLDTNPSYVFFRFADAPIGSLGVPVTQDRTIAADARVFPKGALAFIAAERPTDATGTTFRPFSRFVLDQDAGGAIRTSARIDIFFGSGAYAENAAGRLQHKGQLYYLLLRKPSA